MGWLAAVTLTAGLAVGTWVAAPRYDPPLTVRVDGTDPRVMVDGLGLDAYLHGVPLICCATGGTLRYLPSVKCLVLEWLVPNEETYAGPLTPANSTPRHGGLIWPPGSRVVREGDRVGVQVLKSGTFWAGDRLNVDVGRAPVRALANPPLPPACLGVILDYLVEVHAAT